MIRDCGREGKREGEREGKREGEREGKREGEREGKERVRGRGRERVKGRGRERMRGREGGKRDRGVDIESYVKVEPSKYHFPLTLENLPPSPCTVTTDNSKHSNSTEQRNTSELLTSHDGHMTVT